MILLDMARLAVFRTCEGAPSGFINDRVYVVTPRALNFRWWHEAPDGAKAGDEIQGPVIEQVLPPHTELEEVPHGDLTINTSSLTEVEMEFMGGPGAPSGHEVGDRVILPMRYARFNWWKIPDS